MTGELISAVVILTIVAVTVLVIRRFRKRHRHTIPDWAAFTTQGAVFVGGICPSEGCGKLTQGEFLGNLWDDENPIVNADGSTTYPARSGFAEAQGYTVFPLMYLQRCVAAGVHPYDGVDREAYGVFPGSAATVFPRRDAQ
jgi:hypothetical protein